MKKSMLFIPILICSCFGFDSNKFVVFDKTSQFFWEKESSSVKLSWSKAEEYCHNKNMRMPTIDEIKSLIDYDEDGYVIVRENINIKKDDWYWTSSEPYRGAMLVRVTHFSTGNDNYLSKNEYHYVLCVQY